MTTRMTPAEIDELLDRPLHAVLATHAPEGPPQVSPVWYLYEDGRLYVSIVAGSVKHRNLERNAHVSVCIDGGREDVRAVMLYGEAMLGPPGLDQDEMRWRIIRRYYGSDGEARAYLDTMRDVPHVVLVLNPERVVSQDFND